MIRGNLQLQKETKTDKFLAQVKTNQTLYLDDDENMWDYDKPDNMREVLKRNTNLYIKHNFDGDINEDCKFVAYNKNGCPRIGFLTLSDAIDWGCINILEFTNECKNLYLKEKAEVRDE